MPSSEDSRPKSRRTGLFVALGAVALAAAAGLYWQTSKEAAATGAQTAKVAAGNVEPASYPAPGKDPVAPSSAKTDFPAGAIPISGPEIVAALSNHTALLPGGFVEYYAPDGTIHGLAQDKHYGGSWTVRQGDFCTLLQDSNDSICSPVEKRGDTLYWSMDGEEQASQIVVVPGNPRNIQ